MGLDAGIVCIQEPFLGRKNLAPSGFNLYWPAGPYDRKDNRVLIAVRKDLLNTTVIENKTDLISHPWREISMVGDKRGKPGLLMCMTAS